MLELSKILLLDEDEELEDGNSFFHYWCLQKNWSLYVNLKLFQNKKNVFNTHIKGYSQGMPGGSACEESACNAGDASLIPVSGRAPGRGHSNPP